MVERRGSSRLWLRPPPLLVGKPGEAYAFRDVVLYPSGHPIPLFGVDLDPLQLDAEMNAIASRLAGGAARTMLCPIFTRSACWVLERW
jgi:hypothetical protein